MQEGRAKYEIDLLHRRINGVSEAITQSTRAIDHTRFRLRAIENTINRNWFLRIFLGFKKIDLEVAHINQQEALAREAEDKARMKMFEAQKKMEANEVEQAKLDKAADIKVKARNRELKKELGNVKK